MNNEKRHGFRNFVLFLLTLGIAWYLWKELQKADETDSPDNDSEPVIDVTTEGPEDETLLEPALVTPEPAEQEATAEPDTSSEVEIFISMPEVEQPLDDTVEETTGVDIEEETQVEGIQDVLEELEDGPALEDDVDETPAEDLGAVIEAEGIQSIEPPLPVADEPGRPAAIDETEPESLPAPEVESESEPAATEPEPEPTSSKASGPPAWVQPTEDGQCPEGYPVKARFATGHYHEPGDRGYEKIVPDCCYADASGAEADGFTPSRW